jgi:hypothetical protein
VHAEDNILLQVIRKTLVKLAAPTDTGIVVDGTSNGPSAPQTSLVLGLGLEDVTTAYTRDTKTGQKSRYPILDRSLVSVFPTQTPEAVSDIFAKAPEQWTK